MSHLSGRKKQCLKYAATYMCKKAVGYSKLTLLTLCILPAAIMFLVFGSLALNYLRKVQMLWFFASAIDAYIISIIVFALFQRAKQTGIETATIPFEQPVDGAEVAAKQVLVRASQEPAVEQNRFCYAPLRV